MKIGIQTWGSDGDILPFMALAQGLQAAGHDVTLAYTSVDNKCYDPIARHGGFAAFRAYQDFQVGIHDALADVVATRDPMQQFVRLMDAYFEPATDAMYDASRDLCRDNDVVIGHMMCHTLLTAAELRARPRVAVALAPMAIRTKSAPLFGPDLGPLFNRLSWTLGDYLGRSKLFARAAAIRREEHLKPLRSLQQQLYVSPHLTLVASSEALIPRPQDWAPQVQICGPLALTEGTAQPPMPEGLEAFLQAGPPPVFMGFGSLGPYDSVAMDRLMSEAAELAGCRAILQGSADGGADGHVFRCRRAPHARIFPRCSAIVHHGGAGTTHTALQAGRPAVVVAHAFDQDYWGNALRQAGVAGPPLHRHNLTAEKLASALARILGNPDFTHKAGQLASRMAGEVGVSRAVRLVEEAFPA